MTSSHRTLELPALDAPLRSALTSIWLTTCRDRSQSSGVTLAVRLREPITAEALRVALRVQLLRHPTVCTSFDVRDGLLLESGERREPFTLEVVSGAQLASRADSPVFDLAHGPVVRSAVVVQNGFVTELVIEGSQLALSEQALHDVVCAAIRQPSVHLAGDLALESRSVQAAPSLDLFRELAPLVEVAGLHTRPPQHPNGKGTASLRLDESLLRDVANVAEGLEITLDDVLFSVSAVVTARYSGRALFAVGRLRATGALAEPVAVPVSIEATQAFSLFAQDLARMRRAAEGIAYSGSVRELGDEAPAYNAGFQTSFTSYDLREEQRAYEVASISRRTERLDLEVLATVSRSHLELTAVYAEGIQDRDTMVRFLGAHEQVLRAVVVDPKRPLGHLPLLSAGELETLRRLNDTLSPYDQDDCVQHVFERQVEATPDRLAYVFEEKSFTYRQLNQACNRLAHRLRALGVGPEVPVALFVSRSEWIGIGSIAIFKSGGVFVPLDPTYPTDRLGYMLSCVSPSVVLTTRRDRAGLPPSTAQVVVLDDELTMADLPDTNPTPALTGYNTAYVLFTSGTTGKPKAIQMPHRAFRNMPIAHRSRGLLAEENRVLQFASVAFAVCLGGSFMAWAAGGSLHQVNDLQSTPGEPLFTFLREQRINMVSWPVSLLASLPDLDLPDLKTVISTAEPCTDAVARRWCQGRRFINMYGSSEVAMGSTLFEWTAGASVSLGRPFPNNEIYVVDESLRPLPMGVVGEIAIASNALANGYLHRPDATAEKFAPNPFSTEPGSRLYRTGDLGRYLANGEIQYVGRRDFQVSVRGFRIEMLEVEQALALLSGVEAAAVSVRPDPFGRDRLVGYVVMRPEGRLDRSALRRDLARTLPDYMIPSLLVALDRLPLTPNRKLDRMRLPEPDLAAQLEEGYAAPDGELECAVAEMWSKALKVERIGRNHGFFQIGGHSLLAAMVISEVRSRFGVELALRVLIENDTIATFAREIASARSAAVAS